MCKGPNPNQILYFEDPVIGALPAEHRIAGLQGGMGNVNAWTYTEEEDAQGWRPTVVQGRVIAAAALQARALLVFLMFDFFRIHSCGVCIGERCRRVFHASEF